MLAAFVLCGLICAPVATVILLSPVGWVQRRAVGLWPWTRRLVNAAVGTVALCAAAGLVMLAIGSTHRHIEVSLVVFAVVSAGWMPFTRRWSARAHVCWSATLFLFVAYLAFMLQWTFSSGMTTVPEVGGTLLWVLEAFAALLGGAYLWELCDALGSQQWRRRIERGAPAVTPGKELPFVSLHVPAHNEPPDMVIETLASLKALDYEHYEIVAIDDNTDDESLWRPVEAWCRDNGVTFAHLDDWPGYKSGALNYALANLTDPRAELIGVVDSDYQIEPDFLRRCAPLFAEPTVGFIQAPQDYRDWQQSAYYRRLYYSYQYFFAVSQPSRNERDGAIFAGTMGLIRRQALQDVGGWDEWCITEDAELSMRLLRAGWSGLHVDKSFGCGVMPLTFEALKGQRFRWCFGGIQILRRYWRSMLPGRRHSRNQMTLGQRWAYLSGAVQWYGDLLALVFFIFMLVGAANVAFGGGLLFRKLSGFVVATIPVLVGVGLIRAVALLRRSTGAGWGDAFGAFMIWQSTALVTARASVQALFAKEAEFLRTPKTVEGEARLRDAVRGNRGETALALLGVLGIIAALTHPHGYAGPLTAGLLVWPTFAFAAAPYNSYAAMRAALPERLANRRRTEFLRIGFNRRTTLATGGFALAAVAAVAMVGLLAPGPSPLHSPQIVGPARGQRAAPATTGSPQPLTTPSGPGRTATPSPTGTTAPSTSPSPSVTNTAGGASPSATPSSPRPTTSSARPSPSTSHSTPATPPATSPAAAAPPSSAAAASPSASSS